MASAVGDSLTEHFESFEISHADSFSNDSGMRFVDVIVETRPGWIVLVERTSAPFGFALPGGYVDRGESNLAAAMREVHEETGLLLERCTPWGLYRFVDDAGTCRGVSAIFTAIGCGIPIGGDDARSAIEAALTDLPKLIDEHREILADYQAAHIKSDQTQSNQLRTRPAGGMRILRSSRHP